jgi:uncharacterized repeat protein (TIGR03803 family)
MNYKKFLGAASAALMIVIAIFMLAPGAWAQDQYKTLYKFTGGADGNEFFSIFYGNNWFSSGLVFDEGGDIYGTTAAGGAHGYGVVFKLAPNGNGTSTESVLYSFTGGTDGANPLAGLIFDGAGNLYGTTSAGGTGSCNIPYASGCGVVFELTPNSDGSWTEIVLYSFSGGADGAQPEAHLTFDTAGNLYGTTDAGGVHLSGPCASRTANGCGVVFELTPNSNGTWTESVLHAFTGGNDGAAQIGSLILDAAGSLYGTAQLGKYSAGVVFKLTPNAGSWKETILHAFDSPKDGADPFSFTGLVFDSAGNLYGTTFWGGYLEAGTVFKLTPTSSGPWKWSLVHRFGTGDAYHPLAGVIFDAAGNLYGTAYGLGGCGIVFQLTPSSGGWKEKTLHTFLDRPGCDPMPGVVIDGAGNLYGATLGDGHKTMGSVYEITP